MAEGIDKILNVTAFLAGMISLTALIGLPFS
jgi:hypothetical protein